MFIISKLVQRKRIIRSLTQDDEEDEIVKSKGITKSRSFVVPEQLKELTPLQAKALRLTWKRLNGKGGQLSNTPALKMMTDIFNALCDEDKRVKHMFYTHAFVQGLKEKSNFKIVTIRDHARSLCKTIDQVVDSIESIVIHTPSKSTRLPKCKVSPNRLMEPYIRGKGHCFLKAYGFHANLWERFGEIFIEQLFLQDCVKAYPGASMAWTRVIAMLTDELRAGFEQRNSNGCSLYEAALVKSLSMPACTSSSTGGGPTKSLSSHAMGVKKRMEDDDDDDPGYSESAEIAAAWRKLALKRMKQKKTTIYSYKVR